MAFDTFIGGGGSGGGGGGGGLPLILGSPASPLLITAAGGLLIPSGSPVVVAYVKGNGGPIAITALPSITTAGIAIGTILYVLGTDDTDVVEFQTDTDLSGSKMKINGPVFLNSINALPLILGADGFWRQLAGAVK